jgi:probable phosphoglycerate mutase
VSIYIVRHGETDLNATHVVQLLETPLNARGRVQAERLGARFAPLDVGHILSSDLARAVETAAAIAARTAAPVTYDRTLRERHFGDLCGTPYAELDGDIFAPGYVPPGGESWETFWERVAIAWRKIVEAAHATAGRHLVVVTHGLVCHALLDRHARCAEPVPPRWHNTSVTELEHAPPWRARTVNCIAHLTDGDGIGATSSDDSAAV